MTAYTTYAPIERLAVISDILDLTRRGVHREDLEDRLRLDVRDLASLLLLLKEENAVAEEKGSGLKITETGVSLLEEAESRERHDEGFSVAHVSAYYGDYPSGSGLFCTELVNQILMHTNYDVEVFSSELGENGKLPESNRWFTVHRGVTTGMMWNVNPLTVILPQLAKRSFDLLHVHSYLYLTSMQAALARRLRHTKMILHLHGGMDGNGMLNTEDRPKIIFKEKIFDRTLGRFVANSADIVVSSSRRDLILAQEKWGIPEERIELVPPAVNTDIFRPSSDFGAKKRLVFLGRLESWKGFPILLEAIQIVAREYADFELLVAGSGSQQQDLEEEVRRKDLPVSFLGRIPHSEVPDLLHQAYATVMPSYLEGLPLACLESMAAGVPVIASNVGAFREVIMDGETGLLVEGDNSHRLANAILALLEDEPLRRKLGAEARALMLAEYSWNVVFDRIMSVYRRTLAGSAS